MSTCIHPNFVTDGDTKRPHVPEYVSQLKPYIPGKSVAAVAREFGLEEARIVKLASNENPLGMSPFAKAAVMQTLADDMGQYPDPDATLLKQSLSERFAIPAEWIIVGNGSSDILEVAARTFVEKGESTLYSEYAFASYAVVTQSVGARGIQVRSAEFAHDLDGMLQSLEPDTKLIFVANPNNPTGTFLSGEELYDFLLKVPEDVVVVLDEAYTEYLSEADRYDSIGWTSQFPNLLVLRTFSKAYGLASLRIGFAVGHPRLVSYMNRMRQVFNVNAAAQTAAIASLQDTEFVQRVVAINRVGREHLYLGFESLGLTYLPSHANFVLVKVGDAARINQELLKQGVIVRPVLNYGLPEWLRVTVGIREQNERFLAVLKRIL